MENSEHEETSDDEETKILFMGIKTQTLEDQLDVEGEVDLMVELISALEELRKRKNKNKKLISQLSQYEEEQKLRNEESRKNIVDLKN